MKVFAVLLVIAFAQASYAQISGPQPSVGSLPPPPASAGSQPSVGSLPPPPASAGSQPSSAGSLPPPPASAGSQPSVGSLAPPPPSSAQSAVVSAAPAINPALASIAAQFESALIELIQSVLINANVIQGVANPAAAANFQLVLSAFILSVVQLNSPPAPVAPAAPAASAAPATSAAPAASAVPVSNASQQPAQAPPAPQSPPTQAQLIDQINAQIAAQFAQIQAENPNIPASFFHIPQVPQPPTFPSFPAPILP